jgi:hypothetical protein
MHARFFHVSKSSKLSVDSVETVDGGAEYWTVPYQMAPADPRRWQRGEPIVVADADEGCMFRRGS